MSALSILEEGDIGPRDMVGSWAGAMGQTQFMPSSFLEYAVDFDGGGRRDIWSNARRRDWFDRELSRQAWMEARPALGLRGSSPDDFALDGGRFRRLPPPSPHSPAGRRACGRRADADGGRGAMLLMPAGLQRSEISRHGQFQGDQELQQFDILCLGRRLARRRDPRPWTGPRAAWPTHERRCRWRRSGRCRLGCSKMGYDVGEIDGRVGDTLHAAVRRISGQGRTSGRRLCRRRRC